MSLGGVFGKNMSHHRAERVREVFSLRVFLLVNDQIDLKGKKKIQNGCCSLKCTGSVLLYALFDRLSHYVQCGSYSLCPNCEVH